MVLNGVSGVVEWAYGLTRLPNRVLNQCVERYSPHGCGKGRLAVQISANPHVERALKWLLRLFPCFSAKFKYDEDSYSV